MLDVAKLDCASHHGQTNMSDYLRLSTLTAAHRWPPNPARYPYEWMQLTPEPEWETDVFDADSTGLSGPAWAVFCRTSISLLPADECKVIQPFKLMMFNGSNAKACAKRLSPLPPTSKMEIDRLVATNCPWTEDEIKRGVMSIKNQMARWLRKLPEGHIGVARLYDWGKY